MDRIKKRFKVIFAVSVIMCVTLIVYLINVKVSETKKISKQQVSNEPQAQYSYDISDYEVDYKIVQIDGVKYLCFKSATDGVENIAVVMGYNGEKNGIVGIKREVQTDDGTKYKVREIASLQSGDGSSIKIGTVKIPETVYIIGNEALENCSLIVYLSECNPSNLNIHNNVFKGPTGHVVICYNSTNGVRDTFNSIGNSVVYTADSTTNKLDVFDGTIYGYRESGWGNVHSYNITDEQRAIAELAFYNNTAITSFNMEDNSQIKSIPYGCFMYCTNLASVTLSENVSAIEEKAFYGCTKIGNLYLTSSVTSIGNNAFDGMTGTVYYDDSIAKQKEAVEKYIANEENTFKNFKSINSENEDIINNIPSIDIINSIIKLADRIKYIINHTIEYDGVVYLGLTKELTGTENIAVVESYNGEANKDVAIRNNITINGVEYKVTSIESLINNDEENTSIKGLLLPKGIETIEDNVLDGIGENATVYYYSSSKNTVDNYKNKEGNTFTNFVQIEEDKSTELSYLNNGDGTCSIIEYAGTDKIIGIPETINGLMVTTISSYFTGVTANTLKIPSTVIKIEEKALKNCNKIIYLKECTAAEISIDSNVFDGTEGHILYYNTAGTGVKYKFQNIGGVELSGAGDNSVASGMKVHAITKTNLVIYGYNEKTGTNIKEYIVQGSKNINALTELLFFGNTSIEKFSLKALKGSSSSTDNANISEIPAKAFMNCTNLNSVIMPYRKGISSIGEKAFYGCESLDSIMLSGGVTSIGAKAFDNMASAATVYYYSASKPAVENYEGTFTNFVELSVDEATGISYINNGNGTCTVKGYTKSNTALIIPEELSGLTVTNIDPSFESATISELKIQATEINSIGENALDYVGKIYYRKDSKTATALSNFTNEKQAVTQINTIEVTTSEENLTNKSVTLTVTAKDKNSNEITEYIEYSFDNGEYSATNTKTYEDNKSDITIKAKDLLEIESTAKASITNIDKQEPKITINPNESYNLNDNNNYYQREYRTTVSISDDREARGFKYVWVPVSFNGNIDWNSNSIEANGELCTIYSIPTEQEKEVHINGMTKTGEYKLWVYAADKAGNTTIRTSGIFHLDNKIDKVSTLNITDQEGKKIDAALNTNYIFATTKSDIYISLNNDSEDKLSGVERNVYNIVNYDSAEHVLSNATTDGIITEDGKYLIYSATRDYAGNEEFRLYGVIRDTNSLESTKTSLEFDRNEGTDWKKSYTVNATARDTSGISKIEYAWSDEKEYNGTYKTATIKISEEDETVATTSIVNPSDITGKYYLHVKITDGAGNITYQTTSGTFAIDNSITNPATVNMYLVDENNKKTDEKYENDTWAKQGVFVEIKNGTDNESGYKTAYYTVKDKDGKILLKDSKTATIISEEGIYTIEVTSEDNLGNKALNKYTVKIDKTAISIKFTPQEGYGKTGSVEVKLSDEGSGVNTAKTRYLWSRSDITPKESDFEGIEENNYRGSFDSLSATIETPENESGIWYLWILAYDNAKNVTIESDIKIENGNISHIDNTTPIAGTIEATYEDNTSYNMTLNEETQRYEGVVTNKSIYVKMINGYDADSGVRSNEIKFKKDGKDVEINQNGEEKYLLTDDGVYEVTVKTTDNVGLQAENTYILKIDKTAPTVEFNPAKKEEYAKQHTIAVTVEDNISGVNTSKIKYYWQVNGKNTTETEINQTKFEVKTPEGATGTATLYVYSEDNCGNGEYKNSGIYNVDNTAPTKPEIVATKPQLEGTQQVDVLYYGEVTKEEVTIIAEGSTSLSGVDRYEFTYIKDGETTWSEWENLTKTEKDGALIWQTKITEEGTYIIKARGISELIDGENTGIESEEFIVRIDKTAPTVEYSNIDDGLNGSENWVQSKSVKVTVQDPSGINENTLKYAWVNANEAVDNTTKLNPLANGEPIVTPSNGEGEYKLYVYVEDSIGNIGNVYSNIYKIDKTAPTIKVSPNGGTYDNIANITIDIYDEISGLNDSNEYKYCLSTSKTIDKNASWIDFANGEQFTIGEGLETGTYYVHIKPVSDNAGNITETVISGGFTIKNSTQEETNDGELYIKSDIYKIDKNNMYIMKISPNTKIEDFLNNITINNLDDVEVIMTDNNNKKIIDNSTVVCTGTTIEVKSGNNSIKYILIVRGDVDGDGKANITDIFTINKYRLKKVELDKKYVYAGDVDDDGVTGIDDIRKINKYRLNKINNL